MGKVIVCTGALAKKPFVVGESERKLASIEELCYYVATNLYGIDLGFFSEDLLVFIEKELELPETAKALREFLTNGNHLKDLVTTLLCSSDLYDKEEVLSILYTLTRITGMEAWEKRAHLGYRYLKEGNYLLALSYFRGILKEEKISEKDYGHVLMAMGFCLIHTSSYEAASDCFYKAYMHSRTKETLIFTLLSLKLGGLEEEFKKAAGTLPENDPILIEADRRWKKAYEKAKESAVFRELTEILDRAEVTNERSELEKKLQEFKKEYREGTKHGLV